MSGFEVARFAADASAERIAEEIRTIIDEALDDPELDEEARALLAQVEPQQFHVERTAHNLGAETLTALAMIFAGTLTKEAAEYLWRKAIQPRLDRRLPGGIEERSPEA